MTETDPFRHHPELREKIKPAGDSFFRELDLAGLDARLAEAGFPPDWRTPCEVREAGRREFFKDRWDRDLWVFGYGSLMWDPSIEFVEVRKANLDGYQRCFCLWDEAARGSAEEPGLMLAIDEGSGCEGLAFRIAAGKLEHETFVLFRREMIATAYRPVWLDLETSLGRIEALAFIADRGSENIRPGIPLDVQASMIARAKGILGTNFDYLSDSHAHLELLGIHDEYVSGMFAAASARRGAGR